MSAYRLSPQVQRVISGENISPDEFQAMLRKAAIFTHERGNRRFHSWIFEIRGDTVLRMSQEEIVEVEKPGSIDLTANNICDACDGEGCKECGYIGEIVTHYYKVVKARK